MPATLEVFDCWRSSLPSLSSPILFDVCGRHTGTNQGTASGMEQYQNDSKDGGKGEQLELLTEVSIDSSIQAWSEDGHRDHIIEGQRRRAALNRRSSVKERRRSSPIVNGSLILSADCDSKQSSLLKRRHPTKSMTMSIATLPPRNLNVLSAQAHHLHPSTTAAITISPPCRMSSASFTSPLSKFPSIPARGEKGLLTNRIAFSQSLSQTATGTPTTAKPSLQFPTYHGLRTGPLVVKNASPLVRQISQTRVDDSPLDTPTMTAKRWTIEQDSPVARTASTLIDTLLHGVQHSALNDTIVESPLQTDFSFSGEAGKEEGQEEEWETEDCAMTPQLRDRWQELSPVSSTVSAVEATEGRGKERKATDARPQSSFLDIPSSLFPHTPARPEIGSDLRRQTSIGIRRRSKCPTVGIASSPSSSKRQSSLYRNSALFSTTATLSSSKRRSVHAVSTPRIVCRKSKYYSRQPKESGLVPPIVQQHVQGARGKFWSPLNNKRQSSSACRPVSGIAAAEYQARCPSSRFSRRSGQAWLQPKTIEDRSEFKVTVYPPQIEQTQQLLPNVSQSGIEITIEDTDRTPTQALFKRVTLLPNVAVKSSFRDRASSHSSSTTTADRGQPRIPPPAVSLPALPMLGANRSSFARDVRRSLRSSRAISLLSCSCTATSLSGTCSCTTDTTNRASTISFGEASSECLSCSCTDQSVCSCTGQRPASLLLTSSDADSSFSIRLAERTTPLSAPIRAGPKGFTSYPEPPFSAPFYSSLRPPVLEPLPRLSPLNIDFFSFDTEGYYGGRSRLSKRYSTFSTASTCLTCSTVCTTSTQCSECRRLQQSQRIRIQNGISSPTDSKSFPALHGTDSPSYNEHRSPSSILSSPESDMEESEDSSSSSTTQDSEPPLTPPRSEYHDNVHVESPGYRVSLIVSPIPPSVKEEKAMAGELYSSYTSSVESDLHYLADGAAESSETSSSSSEYDSIQRSRMSYYTDTTAFSSDATSRGPPRSILKTSSRYQSSEEGLDTSKRRPNVTLSLVTSNSNIDHRHHHHHHQYPPMQKRTTGISFQTATKPSSSARCAQQVQGEEREEAYTTTEIRQHPSITRAASALPEDLDRRIQREDHRRLRNESRLYALDKLEGKETKSSLFSALVSTSSAGQYAAVDGARLKMKNSRNDVMSMTGWQEVGEGDDEGEYDDIDNESFLFENTPLTPIQRDLIELEREAHRRRQQQAVAWRQRQHRQQQQQQHHHHQSTVGVDVAPSAAGFDMFICPKLFSIRKKKKHLNKHNTSSSSHTRSSISSRETQQDERLKTQMEKLGMAVEVRQIARDRCIDQ